MEQEQGVGWGGAVGSAQALVRPCGPTGVVDDNTVVETDVVDGAILLVGVVEAMLLLTSFFLSEL